MPRESDIPPEGFDELLAWLNPDREIAGSIYVELRHALVKIFGWNHYADPEGMTDETFDRVAKQIGHLRATFDGDPKRFFYGVARNLMREYQKKVKSYVSIDGVELPSDPPPEIEDETAEMLEECLQACLGKMDKEKRDLVLAYYAKEKRAKIDHRTEIARQLGISVETLRVRMCRTRTALEKCIRRCLDELAVRR